MSINKVFISGNLTRDCELRATQGGSQVLTFGVAVNDRRRNPQSGEWEDYPNFIDCVVFGNRASALQKFLSKGSKVAIEGKLRYSSWEKDGHRRSKIEVIVDECEFLSGSKAQNQPQQTQPTNYPNQYQNGPYSAPQQPQTGYQQPMGYQSDLSDTPIPF